MTVAVVGTGSIGRRHLRNLADLGHDVVAVSERSRAPSVTIGDRDVPCVASLGEALDGGATAVFVGNPTSMHESTTREAIAAGVDVYLEKPAAMTGAEAAELAALAEAAEVVVAVGQQLRFHPLLEQVRSVLESGRLGTILAVEANLGEHLADYHPDEDYRQGYAARRELGGGVLLTQIHLIDVLIWIGGPFRSVCALGGHRSDLELDVEDSVSFLARTSDEVPVYGHLDYLQRPKRWQLSVTGTTGRLDLDLHAGTLTVGSGSDAAAPESVQVEVDRNALFVAATRDFLRAARDRTRPCCDLVDATDALDAVDAIKESMGSGSVATIEDRRAAPAAGEGRSDDRA